VVIKRSSSAEVTRLIDALLAPDPVKREAAAARLAVVGGRAVERLAVTLPGLRSLEHVRAVLDVLERIGDARSAAAAEPLLRHAEPSVAAAAVAVLRRTLNGDDAGIAARATDALVSVAVDPACPEEVRMAAMDALAELPDDVIAPLRARIPPRQPTGSRGTDGTDVSPSRRSPSDLLVPARPPGGVSRPEGPPRADEVPARVDTQPGGARPGQVRSLEAWADVAGDLSPDELRDALQAHGSEAALPTLHRVLERVRRAEAVAPESRAVEWRTMRGAVHRVLAERHSRVALYDLRENLERSPETLTVAMLGALATIGDAACLEPVAAAWARTGDAWLKGQLRDVFAAIVGREALTRRHAVVRRVAAHHPGLVASVSTLSRTRPSPPPADRT
jgi:hypothetical protein